MENTLSPQIQQTINYYTNRLGRAFRLQAADRDDVRQELTLKALEAIQSFRPDVGASIETYVKQVLCRRAVDLARELTALPHLQSLSVEPFICAFHRTIDLATDVQTLIRTMTPRQKKICCMLMAGFTQESIALRLRINQSSICREIQKIRAMIELIL